MIGIRKYSIIIFLLFCFLGVSAQKYRDIFPYFRSDSTSFANAQRVLLNYIKENPLDANPHYQYGLLCVKHAKTFDVLMQTELHLKYLKIAITEYKLALNYMDEKDVNRNVEYYPEFSKTDAKGKLSIDYNEVRSKLTNDIAILEPFVSNLQDISKVFSKSVDYYQRARNSFNEINVKYRTLNNLYLLANSDFFYKANQLKNYYDSAIIFIEEYKLAIKKFPLEKYNQEFEIKTIETYRLDGFEEKSSFLLPKIIIWNYADWVVKVLNVVNTDVADLRLSIEKAQVELNDGINLLKNSTESFSLPQEYKLNKSLVQKIKKFDNNSLMLHLLNFQKNYLDLLIAYRSPMNSDTIKVSYNEKLEFINKQMLQINLCDSLINVLQIANKPLNFEKYNEVLTKYFKSFDGLFEYLNTTKTELKKDLETFASKVKETAIKNELLFEDTSKFIVYKGKNIPLFQNKTLSLNNSEYHVFKIVNDSEGNTIICGNFIDPENKRNNGFIGKINNGKIVWFKSVDNKQANSNISAFSLLNDGVIYIQNCKGDTNKNFQNTIIRLDKFGKEKQTVKFESSYLSSCIAACAASGNVAVLFEEIAEASKNIEVQIFDQTLKQIGKYQFKLDGLNCDVNINTDEVLIVGSYKTLMLGNNLIKNGNSIYAPFVISIDLLGNIKNKFTFNADKSVIVKHFIINSTDNINIYGVFSSNPNELLLLQQKNLSLLKLNSQLKLIYKNF